MATYPQELSITNTISDLDFQAGCVPNAVAAKATKWPDATALTDGSEILTYHELDSRSNRVAQYLRSLGVGPDVLVGVCLERSLDLVVAMLGILKAGGAYLPLDHSYPPDRLSFMLDDARAPLLITSEHLSGRVPSKKQDVVMVGAPEISEQPDHPPHVDIMPDDLAYVIYTSGSTGRPKGVEVTHGGLANLVCWHRQAFQVTPGDRASHVAGLGFDAAVWELWPYLTAGASVHMADEVTRSSAELLRDFLLARKLTISFVPTPLAEQMLTLEWPNQTPLRMLLTGGDILHHYPPVNLPFMLVNNYGPTECTVVATSAPVLSDKRSDPLPHIGRPIANVLIYILDEDLRPVPPGTPGEIHVGGAGLARGYRNRPDLTSEKFIVNPFSAEPGSRLYKTGDIGRLLPDGNIAFIGRVDDQIKIRGYRIEPNEIVSVLDQHPDIRESLVVAREDSSGEKRLVAYVILTPDSRTNASAIRDSLRQHLPEYMLPTTFVRLDEFPLTSHGKIDRDALPEPTVENSLGNAPVEAPGSPVEERLTGILQALLGIDQIGVDDNFFQMGGHSLLGAQMIAHVRDAFAVELSLRSLFDHPTVREMSAEIERLILAKLEAMGGSEATGALSSPESANA
ncbi:MAG TPA: non-ribosomal peptide synthetase [Bryobacteraceae bacterium]|nr:non-ribosomal peptide synthetase [Bryobacteraceae bacterium]